MSFNMTSKEIEKEMAPMEMDLWSVFSLMQEEVLEKVNDPDQSPERLIAELEKM